jgi:hypothetical protein
VPALTGQCPDPAWGAWTLTRMLPHGMVAKHRFGMLARWVSPEARQGDLSQGSFTAPPEASNSRANKSFALAGPACIMVRKLIASSLPKIRQGLARISSYGVRSYQPPSGSACSAVSWIVRTSVMVPLISAAM